MGEPFCDPPVAQDPGYSEKCSLNPNGTCHSALEVDSPARTGMGEGLEGMGAERLPEGGADALLLGVVPAGGPALGRAHTRAVPTLSSQMRRQLSLVAFSRPTGVGGR